MIRRHRLTTRAFVLATISALSLTAITTPPAFGVEADGEPRPVRESIPEYLLTTPPLNDAEESRARSGTDAAAEAATVSGRVTNSAGEALPGVQVNIFGFNGAQGDAELVHVVSTEADIDGLWTATVSPKADYWEVYFSDPALLHATEGWPGVSIFYYPDPLLVAPGDVVDGIDAKMQRSASIAGLFSGAGFTPEPWGLRTHLLVRDGLGGEWVQTAFGAWADDDTRYLLTGPLIAGEYRVEAEYSGKYGSGSVVSNVIELDEAEAATWDPVIERDVVRNNRDFSGDGLPDVLARAGNGNLLAYLGNGNSSWSGASTVGWGWQNMSTVLLTDDFDGDGLADVLARTNSGELWMYPSNGQGGWKTPRKIGVGWQSFTRVLSPGDFDGDGRTDIMGVLASGSLYLYRGDGAGGWLGSSVVGWGWQGFSAVLSPGDFDSDGASDVLARDTAGGLHLYRGNGAGGWLAPSQVGWGWNSFTSIIAGGDFSGDGPPDVLARNLSGNLIMYRGNGYGGWVYGAEVVGTGWAPFALVE